MAEQTRPEGKVRCVNLLSGSVQWVSEHVAMQTQVLIQNNLEIQDPEYLNAGKPKAEAKPEPKPEPKAEAPKAVADTSMKMGELRKLAADKGITVKVGTKKADLVQQLNS